jgi:hypothetical protein
MIVVVSRWGFGASAYLRLNTAGDLTRYYNTRNPLNSEPGSDMNGPFINA